MNTDKLAINWQNFARVRLQLKFVFMITVHSLEVITSLKSRVAFCKHKSITVFWLGMQSITYEVKIAASMS